MKALTLDAVTVGRIKHALETAHEALPQEAKAELHEAERALNALDDALKGGKEL